MTPCSHLREPSSSLGKSMDWISTFPVPMYATPRFDAIVLLLSMKIQLRRYVIKKTAQGQEGHRRDRRSDRDDGHKWIGIVPITELVWPPCQNSKRATTCIWRAWKPFAKLVTCPKLPEPNWKAARSKRVRFRALNASMRTCSFFVSRILNSFRSARST